MPTVLYSVHKTSDRSYNNLWLFRQTVKSIKTLIYLAVGLYDTHSFEWLFLLKSLCTKNSETICITSPKYCLSTYAFKFMKQNSFHKFLSTFFKFWNLKRKGPSKSSGLIEYTKNMIQRLFSKLSSVVWMMPHNVNIYTHYTKKQILYSIYLFFGKNK